MSESVLVTGGSGFIGRSVVELLTDSGYEVTVLTHRGEVEIDGIQTVHGDITDYNSLPEFDAYTTVVHLAGSASVSESVEHPSRTWEVNATGTKNVLERARNDGVVSFLYASSGAVYGSPKQLPVSEESSTDPLHPYAASKLAGEHLVRAYETTYGLETWVTRIFTAYGPGQDSDNLVPEVVRKAQTSQKSISLGNLDPTRDFVYVEDVASGIQTILDTKPPETVFNIGSEEEHSVEKVVETILSEFEKELQIDSKSGRAADIEIPRLVADCSRLKQYGWKPRFSIEEGIARTVQSITENND